MEKSTSIGGLAKALATFQGKVPAIKKDAQNPFFKSKYASLGNIIDKIKAPLAECGLSYCQLPDGDESLTTILMHAETGEYLQATYQLHAAKKDPQGIGSAITYARRYALSALLGLNTDDDDDGNEANGNGAKNGQSTQPTDLQQTAIRAACLTISNLKTHAALLEFRDKQPDYVRNDSQFIAAGEGQWGEIELDLNNAAPKKPVAA